MASINSQIGSESRSNPNADRLNNLDTSQLSVKNQVNNEKQIISNQNAEDDVLDDQTIKKKNQNKQKYRRLKQKLASLCSENQQKCLIKSNKQVSSSNKPRLLTLAIQFQKITVNQFKDYNATENKLKQIHKILDSKWENDLVILRQSRFVPAFCALLKKVPAFHKNQFLQSVKTIQLGLKVLRVFCTLAANREYMITTNQLSTLNSCLNSFISKEEKKLSIQCLNILLELLCSKIKSDSEQIVNVTLQIVFFGQLARKLRQAVQSCVTQDGIIQEQYVLKCLKYLHILYRKCYQKYLQRPIYQKSQIPQILQFHLDSLLIQLYQLLPILLLDKQQGCLKDEQLPICHINITLYMLKLINICLHVSLDSAQKIIQMEQKSSFSQTIYSLFKYSFESIQQSVGNYEISCMYSQVIDFLGKICCESQQNRIHINKTGLLQMLYNHPIVYIMDPKLKSLLIPSLCSVMNGSETNMKKYLSQNSAQNIINYVSAQKKRYQELQIKQKQIQNGNMSNKQKLKQDDLDQFQAEDVQQQIGIKKLNRKQSVSSLNSYTTQCTQNSYTIQLTDSDRSTTGLYFLVPFNHWQNLIQKLQIFDS